MCGIFCYIAKAHPEHQSKLNKNFMKIKHRGPDATNSAWYDNVFLGFHRLAIMDLSDNGVQPFEYRDLVCITNGEIYNYKELSKELGLSDIRCDCEVILPLFDYVERNMNVFCNKLDGEYAIIIYDRTHKQLYVCSDELRVRPIFVGHSSTGTYFSSEIKAISDLCDTIEAFPAGSYLQYGDSIKQYFNFRQNIVDISYQDAAHQLRELLTFSVKSKLHPERDYGFLLSGGIDSSLVASIASKLLSHRIKTFTIGFSYDSPDIIAARKVAKFINSEHHEIIIPIEEGLKELENVVYYNESYDETTTRASTPMKLAVKYIKETYPEICVIYSGEVADELLGSYLYFFNAPSSKEHREECIRLLEEIHLYDGLRADRVTSSVSCELRLPFFNKHLLSFVLSLPYEYLDPKKNNMIEKKILRDAFDTGNYLPKELLWRTKNAMSDAVGYSWKDALKEHAKKSINYERFGRRHELYEFDTPQTEEEFYYRELFNKYYDDKFANLIPHKWLPKWSGDIRDSSATFLDVFSSKVQTLQE